MFDLSLHLLFYIVHASDKGSGANVQEHAGSSESLLVAKAIIQSQRVCITVLYAMFKYFSNGNYLYPLVVLTHIVLLLY